MVKSFSEIGSYQMIFYIEDKKKLIILRDQYLKELYKVDQEGSSQLLETLREYLIQNGNMLQTAKNLFIHRNTLQYRIDRIKTIANIDINDFNIKRDLLNAFIILDIIPFS
jgi:DNA-binding PucR family transcriptional regulator